MPSADITPKGQHFLMHETQMRSWGMNRFWAGTNFYAYGAGKSTEIALTSYGGGSPLSPTFASGVGFKSAPLIKKDGWLADREAKLTFGSMAILNHRGKGLGNFSYAHYSMRVPKFNTRITGGGWFGTEQLFKVNTGNVLAGIEQPVGKRFNLLAEWFGGSRHDMSYFIPGILFHPKRNHFIVFAYKIPNPGSGGSHGIVLEYGLVFGRAKEEVRGH